MNEIVCQRHGPMFDRRTSLCIWDPREGAGFDAVDQADGVVRLDEPGWTVVDQADGHGSRGGMDR